MTASVYTMKVIDMIYESINNIIDGCMNFYREHEILEIVENDAIVDVLAFHLKVVCMPTFYKITEEDLSRIDFINCEWKARKHIRQLEL